MKDPYKTLNIGRNATQSVIKKAYRQRAKELHPDHGGDAETFAELSMAYALLTDRMRRDRYDRTGSTEEVLTSEAWQMICHKIVDLLKSKPIQAFIEKDILADIRSMLVADKKEYENQAKAMDIEREKIDEILRRLNSPDDNNPIIFLLNDHRERFANNAEVLRNKAIDCNKAIQILKRFTYRFDATKASEFIRMMQIDNLGTSETISSGFGWKIFTGA